MPSYTVELEQMEPGFVIPFFTWLRVNTGYCNVVGECSAALHLAGCELTKEQAYMVARLLDDGWITGRLVDDETRQMVAHKERPQQ